MVTAFTRHLLSYVLQYNNIKVQLINVSFKTVYRTLGKIYYYWCVSKYVSVDYVTILLTCDTDNYRALTDKNQIVNT